MRMVSFALALTVMALASLSAALPPNYSHGTFASTQIHDAARSRDIPIRIILPRNTSDGALAPVIISHGYGQTYDDYDFIAHALVERGHPVVTIQHQIAGDPDLPSSGIIREVRMPFWQSGQADILATLSRMREGGIFPNDAPVILIGHSMGGDQALFTMTNHPEMIDTVITLDHRRVPVPRIASPHFCSLRSTDQVADDAVLPNAEEAAQLGMQITAVPVIHNEMQDGATDAQKAAMLDAIFACLKR